MFKEMNNAAPRFSKFYMVRAWPDLTWTQPVFYCYFSLRLSCAVGGTSLICVEELRTVGNL